MPNTGKLLIARDAKEWVRYAQAIVAKTFAVDNPEDGKTYYDLEKANQLRDSIKFLCKTYADLREVGEDVPMYEPDGALAVSEIRKEMEELAARMDEAHQNTIELYKKVGVIKGENNGQETGTGSGEPTTSGTKGE